MAGTGRYPTNINKTALEEELPSISSRIPARLKLVVAVATIQINTVVAIPVCQVKARV